MGKHNWGNYFVAAYKGVWEHLAEKGLPAPPPCGLQVMVHGTVPTGGWVLSSEVAGAGRDGWPVQLWVRLVIGDREHPALPCLHCCWLAVCPTHARRRRPVQLSSHRVRGRAGGHAHAQHPAQQGGEWRGLGRRAKSRQQATACAAPGQRSRWLHAPLHPPIAQPNLPHQAQEVSEFTARAERYVGVTSGPGWLWWSDGHCGQQAGLPSAALAAHVCCPSPRCTPPCPAAPPQSLGPQAAWTRRSA